MTRAYVQRISETENARRDKDMALLELRDLVVSYGPLKAVKGINLDVEQGKITAMLGANGAGKSSTLKAICATAPRSEGTVTLDGKQLGKRPYEVTRQGISMSPEGRQIFIGRETGVDPTEVAYPKFILLLVLRAEKAREQEGKNTLGRREGDVRQAGRPLHFRELVNGPVQGIQLGADHLIEAGHHAVGDGADHCAQLIYISFFGREPAYIIFVAHHGTSDSFFMAGRSPRHSEVCTGPVSFRPAAPPAEPRALTCCLHHNKK